MSKINITLTCKILTRVEDLTKSKKNLIDKYLTMLFFYHNSVRDTIFEMSGHQTNLYSLDTVYQDIVNHKSVSLKK